MATAINIWFLYSPFLCSYIADALSLSHFDVVIGKIDTAIIWSNVWQLNCHQADRKSISILTVLLHNPVK